MTLWAPTVNPWSLHHYHPGLEVVDMEAVGGPQMARFTIPGHRVSPRSRHTQEIKAQQGRSSRGPWQTSWEKKQTLKAEEAGLLGTEPSPTF